MKGIEKLQFLVETASRHPDPNYALETERAAAEELAKAGWFYDLDDAGHPGCFGFTPAGLKEMADLEAWLTAHALPTPAPLSPSPSSSTAAPPKTSKARARQRRTDTPKP